MPGRDKSRYRLVVVEPAWLVEEQQEGQYTWGHKQGRGRNEVRKIREVPDFAD